MEDFNHPDDLTGRELIITRLFDAPPEKVYRAWTEPTLVKQWFAPLPWTTPSAEMDVRPGGSISITMRSPDGVDEPDQGVFLEVIPNQRLVFTDAYRQAWEPSTQPFMTVIITFEDLGGKTHYTARVLHWSQADRQRHEDMGFHQGWNQCADQLGELVMRI
jgi:uncharacterized protein YndB with AHSA1/START domain